MFRFRGPRRKLTAEETAANAAAKAEREKHAMSCQICARKILANRGKIAHHGYERPGSGWQTSSCFGARELPYEVDRAALGRFVEYLKERRVAMIGTRKEAAAELISFSLTYSEWKRELRQSIQSTLRVTRATWEAVRAEHADIFRSHGWFDFDKIKTADLARRDSEIKNIERDIRDFTKRYDVWKQTHIWSAGTHSEGEWRPI